MCECLIYGSNLSRGSPQIDVVCFMFFSHFNLIKSNTIYIGTQSKFVSGKPFHWDLPSERSPSKKLCCRIVDTKKHSEATLDKMRYGSLWRVRRTICVAWRSSDGCLSHSKKKNEEAFNWGCQRPANRAEVRPTRDAEWGKQEEKQGTIINPTKKDRAISEMNTPQKVSVTIGLKVKCKYQLFWFISWLRSDSSHLVCSRRWQLTVLRKHRSQTTTILSWGRRTIHCGD